jgi:hypothetical protein
VSGRRGRALAAGAGLAGVYVLVALATSHVSGRPVLPLFDGFAPPAPYNWVNPPPGFAKDNQKPADATQDVTLAVSASVTANAATSDGQAIVGLDAGSVPVHFPDTALRLHVVPVDPATLGPLPPGLRPESNAYEVTLAYIPSGSALETLAKPGTVALTAAGPASSLLYSPDGRAWTELKSQPFGATNGLFAALNGPGYYLSASHNAPRTGPKKSRGGLLAVVIALALLGVGGLVLAVPVRRARARVRSRPADRQPGL